MLGLFRKSIYDVDPPAFGVDLSDYSIKTAYLERDQKQWKLSSFGSHKVPEGAIVEGNVKDRDKVLEVLSHAKESSGGGTIPSRYVVASLPEQEAYISVIQLPKMKPEEAKEAVQYEIENTIPMKIEEVYVDWQIIRPVKDHLDHFDILIAAVSRDVVDQYTSLFEEVGLIPRVFEIESVSTIRSVIPRIFSDTPVFVLDLGEARASFIIFSGRTLRLTSSVEISGEVFTDSIRRAMSIEKKEAEKLKHQYGLSRKGDKGQEIFECLIPGLTDLAEQIKKYIDFYKGHSHEHLASKGDPLPVSKVILCGGGAALKGIDAFLALHLNIPVELANPWVNILRSPLREIPGLSYDKSLSYATALGLALRGAKKF